MDTELCQWVEEAKDIGESGRWSAVNDKIKQPCAYPGVGNNWWVEVFASLCASVFSEYLSLRRANEDANSGSSLIAWRARNLLELSMWSIYCSRSKANARRFYEDAGRDVLGLIGAFAKLSVATGQGDEICTLTQARDELCIRAAEQGIESLEGECTSR